MGDDYFKESTNLTDEYKSSWEYLPQQENQTMLNPYTTVTEKLRESRHIAALLWSIIGLFFGLLLPFNALNILISNEQAAIHRTKTLTEGEVRVISIDANHIKADNEGKLIHLSGDTTTDEILTADGSLIDTPLDVEIDNILKLRRVVEMYQWEEQHLSADEDGTTNATYQKIWSSQPIDSSKFYLHDNYKNPTTMRIKGKTVVAKQIKMGQFFLTTSFVEKLNNYEQLPMTEHTLWEMEDKLSEQLPSKYLHLQEGNYYIGRNPSYPEIGDLRITFEMVRSEPISVIAQQVNSHLVPYQTQTGGEIELFEYGMVSADKMFMNAKIANFFDKIPDRLKGFLLIFFGIYALFSVAWILKTTIPLLGKPAEWVGWAISLILTTTLTLFIIALMWRGYSHKTGNILLVIAVIFLFFLLFARKPVQEPRLIGEAIVPQKKNAF